jgi:hypothetical protein
MTRTAIIIAALLVSSAAHAQYVNGAGLPPTEYDHPYKGKLTVTVMEDDTTIFENCRISLIACAKRREGNCTIFVRDAQYIKRRGYDPDWVMRHEIGHCNGWPASHAGARTAPLSGFMFGLKPLSSPP